MADHYRVVTKAAPAGGFGKKIGDSFKGIIVGILLFVLAFPVLWWGENRKNEAEFVDEASAVDSASQPAVETGTLIKTTGKVTTEQFITDDEFLKASETPRYLRLERDVEMYAWVEKKETKQEGDQEVTTYDYVKKWTDNPADSSGFYDPANHQNPGMRLEDKDFQVDSAKIGALSLDASKADFYDLKKLDVVPAMLASTTKPLQISAGKIYVPVDGIPAASPTSAPMAGDPLLMGGSAAPMTPPPAQTRQAATNPQVGDLRLSYTSYLSGVAGAVVGAWEGSSIGAHVYDKTGTFFGVFPGSLAEFRADLQSTHNMIVWLVRLVSFLMLWIGMNMILGPILTVLDFIPIVGGMGRAAISLVTGAIAFVLWGLTIMLANLWLVLIVVGILGGGIFMYSRKRPSAPSATPAPG